MNERSIDDLADEWITAWARPEPPAIAAGEFGDAALDWDLPHDHPELCWNVILNVLGRIDAEPSNRHFQALAAGPLEDLRANHGESFIERVETRATQSAEFALLLGGVWQSTIHPEVWARMRSCAKGPW